MRTFVLPLTDDRGRPLVPVEDLHAEPEPSSVVLTEGLHGTAWQRHFADGLWHNCAGSGVKRKWDSLIKQRNLVLIYDAEPRTEPVEPRRKGGRMQVLG